MIDPDLHMRIFERVVREQLWPRFWVGPIEILRDDVGLYERLDRSVLRRST